MRKIKLSLLAIGLVAILLIAAGCGGGSDAKRISGLSTEGTVKTFFDAAKAGKMNEAGLYVSPTSKANNQTVLKFITGQDAKQIKKANLLSVKPVSQKGNYAVVLATLQNQQDSMDLTVKPVGLEKIDGEWYIVDADQIYNDAKYNLLQQLMEHI
jgi:hypothetical protein